MIEVNVISYVSLRALKNWFIAGLNITSILLMLPAHAAEWIIEPSVNITASYDDNVRMASDTDLKEESTAYSIGPAVKFAGNELNLWDMSVDARGRMTRHQDVEDADSNNLFYGFNGGRQTERTDWRLASSFERSSNFDTDFETETPDSGLLLDDRTDRDTITVAPSVRWSASETSQVRFSLKSDDVSFDEVQSLSYKNYDYDSAQLVAYWLIGENHQLGFTSSYAEYKSPDAGFSYDQTVTQLDYTYNINQTSNISLSFGGRRIDSLAEGVTVGCESTAGNFNPTGGQCPATVVVGPFVFPVTPVVEDISNADDGTVIDLSYMSKSEITSHSFNAGRTVIPSSFGSAQELRSARYQFTTNTTERFTTRLILDASKVDTISGINVENDRIRYRIEPSVQYKLSQNWSISFVYRYIEQNLTRNDESSISNSVYVNLKLYWPKLVTSY